MPGMDHGTKPAASSSQSPSPSMGDMPGMDHMADGNGLSDTQDGYHLISKDATLPSGKQAAYRFTVTGTGTGRSPASPSTRPSGCTSTPSAPT